MNTSFENIAHDLRQSWKTKSYMDARFKLMDAAQHHLTQVNIHCPGHVFSDEDLDQLADQGIEYTETEDGYTFDISDIFEV